MERDKRYVVIARLDGEAEEKLLELQRRITAVYGGPDPEWPPHLTLAAYEKLEGEAVCAWTEEFARRHAPFWIMIPAVGMFGLGGDAADPAILYAAPASSRELMAFYYDFHDDYDDHCGKLGWLYSMKYGQPVPHVTLGILPAEAAERAMGEALRAFRPLEAAIVALEVDEYPMKPVAKYPLGLEEQV